MNYPLLMALVSVVALVAAFIFAALIVQKDEGNEKMKEIAQSIYEGAMAFLMREYRVISIFVLVLALILGLFLDNTDTAAVNEGWLTSASFVYGAISSVLAGFFGMNIKQA